MSDVTVSPGAGPQSVLDRTGSWPVDTVAGAVLCRDEGGALVRAVASIGDGTRPFALASVTKLLTAWGVLVAVEEGALELDSPAGPPGSTVRHLLAHASGVAFDSREPQRAPGQRRIYSSAGYEILAEVVAEATGFTFADYLGEAVFTPLGMTMTWLEGSAGHAAVSTVSDLSRFAAEALSPRLVSEDLAEEALSLQFAGLSGVVPGYGMQKPADWGLGFELFGSGGTVQGGQQAGGRPDRLWFGENMPADTAGHFGQAGTFLWLHRPSGYAAVVLTDQPFGAWARPLWSDFNRDLWAALVAKPHG